MLINPEKCIGCGSCVHYCPMNAIRLDETAEVDLDECVECGICVRAGVCPVDAFEPQELEYPRILRQRFSDPLISHPGTNVPGRGTEEMKTNEVTGRFKYGHVGIAIELGRPGTGTRLYNAQTIAQAVAPFGVKFEPNNPVTQIMIDKSKGTFKEDCLQEKVLSAIVEFDCQEEQVVSILNAIREAATKIDTVFSLDICSKVKEDGSIPAQRLSIEAGFKPSLNGKTNVGLGRPLFIEEAK
jgi:NAD-dependent dihydropyrimidine dehydrogenase PreA subunit